MQLKCLNACVGCYSFTVPNYSVKIMHNHGILKTFLRQIRRRNSVLTTSNIEHP